jgi:hypothetical protein
MRIMLLACLVACSSPAAPPPAAPVVPVAPVAPTPPVAMRPPDPPKPERLAADTPRTTTEGARFIAPAGWTISVRGPMTILEAPEEGSRIVLVDLRADDADAAVAAAWAAYAPAMTLHLITKTDSADKDGWTDNHDYQYLTSPNEKRDLAVDTYRANGCGPSPSTTWRRRWAASGPVRSR